MRRALALSLLLGSLWACDPQVVIGNVSDAGSGGGMAQGGGGGASMGGGGQTGVGTPASCSRANCPGCCTANGACVRGDAVDACGAEGFECSTCLTGQFCAVGNCLSVGGNGGGTGGGVAATGGGTGGGQGGGSIPTPSPPAFVASTPPVLVTSEMTLTLDLPEASVAGDFLIALITADEGTGPRTLAAPSEWSLLVGWPIHNVVSSHTPYAIPATENHGTWVLSHFKKADDSRVEFKFNIPTTARATIVAYRRVNALAPIHDKNGYGLFGNGDTNGFGSGNTTLEVGRQVVLIGTATTPYATYTTVSQTSGVVERVNSGEQSAGLNVIVSDDTISPRLFFVPYIRHFQLPSDSLDSLMFSVSTLVLAPE